jgi:hypothetical protein
LSKIHNIIVGFWHFTPCKVTHTYVVLKKLEENTTNQQTIAKSK